MSEADIAGTRLREAVAAGRYEAAVELLAEYGRRLEEELGRLGPQDARIPRAREEALELLAWARLVVMTARACCADRLRLLPVRFPYGPESADWHAWVIDA